MVPPAVARKFRRVTLGLLFIIASNHGISHSEKIKTPDMPRQLIDPCIPIAFLAMICYCATAKDIIIPYGSPTRVTIKCIIFLTSFRNCGILKEIII
jgi:hypothetical protein